MQIILQRSASFWRNAFGLALPMVAFFDGQPIAVLKTGERKNLLLPDWAGLLQVGILKADLDFGVLTQHQQASIADYYFSSGEYPLSLLDAGQYFSCGTRLWTLCDFLSLCYTPYFARRMCYIQHHSYLRY